MDRVRRAHLRPLQTLGTNLESLSTHRFRGGTERLSVVRTPHLKLDKQADAAEAAILRPDGFFVPAGARQAGGPDEEGRPDPRPITSDVEFVALVPLVRVAGGVTMFRRSK